VAVAEERCITEVTSETNAPQKRRGKPWAKGSFVQNARKRGKKAKDFSVKKKGVRGRLIQGKEYYFAWEGDARKKRSCAASTAPGTGPLTREEKHWRLQAVFFRTVRGQ